MVEQKSDQPKRSITYTAQTRGRKRVEQLNGLVRRIGNRLRGDQSTQTEQEEDSAQQGMTTIRNFIGNLEQVEPEFQPYMNAHIKTGYRIGFTNIKDIIRSLFMIHNETVNIWTHLGFAIVLIITAVYFVQCYPSFKKSNVQSYFRDFQNNYENMTLAEFTDIKVRYTQDKIKLNRQEILKTENLGFLLLQNIKGFWKDSNDESPMVVGNLISSFTSQIEPLKNRLAQVQYNNNDIKQLATKRLNFLNIRIEQIWNLTQKYETQTEDHLITSEDNYLLNHVPLWPMIVHILSAVFCMSCSACFHLFQVKNILLRKALNRLDVGSISILIMGSSIPCIFYPFACKGPHMLVRDVFFYCIFGSSCINFAINMSRRMQANRYRPYMVAMFITLGWMVSIPLWYVYYQQSQDFTKVYYLKDMLQWVYGGAFYMIGGIVYAKKIPEKHYPRVFDVIGSSHNIFHVFIVIGATIHLRGSYGLYIDRFDKVCPIMK